MPTPNSRLDPFIGYRVAQATEADASSLLRLEPSHPAVRALLDGQRSVTLPPRDAAVVYDAAESVSRALGEPFPLQFTPVRCTRGRALQFERVALSAGEIRTWCTTGSSDWRAVARQQSPRSRPWRLRVAQSPPMSGQSWRASAASAIAPSSRRFGSGSFLNLQAIATALSDRLSSLFLSRPDGSRPVFGDSHKFQTDPHWRDHVLFYEFFHGDTGAGLGAAHQTGWTALVANLL